MQTGIEVMIVNTAISTKKTFRVLDGRKQNYTDIELCILFFNLEKGQRKLGHEIRHGCFVQFAATRCPTAYLFTKLHLFALRKGRGRLELDYYTLFDD